MTSLNTGNQGEIAPKTQETDSKGIKSQVKSLVGNIMGDEELGVDLETKGVKEAPRGNFWLQDDFSVILDGVTKLLGKNNEWRLGYSDYDFNIRSLPGRLGLGQLLDNDQEFQKILTETGSDKIILEHSMAKLRVREIIIQKLLPLVAALPKVYYSSENGDYLVQGVDNKNHSLGKIEGAENTITANNIRNLVEFLILLTKGTGSKLFSLKESDFVNGSTMMAALNKKEYDGIEEMCFNLRGDELINLVQNVFANDKKEKLSKFSK